MAGCAEPAPEQPLAELEGQCGEAGPHLVLPLDSSSAAASSAGQYGDRTLVAVWDLDPEQTGSEPPSRGARHVWSVGPCGEDPVRLEIEDGDTYWRSDIYPGQMMRCAPETGVTELFDPSGQHPPSPLFTTETCASVRAERALGVFNLRPVDDEFGVLELLPWPEDPAAGPAEPIEVIDQVRLGSLRTYDARALLRTSADELVQLTWSAGADTEPQSEVLLENVTSIRSSGPYILGESEGSVLLLNRDTQVTTDLGPGPISSYALYTDGSEGLGFIRYQESSQLTHPPVRFYTLPDLESFELGAFRASTLLSSGYVWGESPQGTVLVDVFAGTSELIYQGPMHPILRLRDDWISWLGCCDGAFSPSSLEEGPLYRSFTDGTLEVLAARATTNYRILEDDRTATLLDIDAEAWAGDLVVVDPDTHEEQLIAAGVRDFSSGPGEREVFYLVDDADRRGVWSATLAPRE
ncbi:hypothetical protein PPSIR1_38801 [Plesiocystis pacifica SIR-1]|uniref:Uncharacterized protein n=1 Tax=Plesiocystis pacifica SIR-1 TaxID=391625 RepID=A6G8T3_9BACT|nr:hypothetical protein [Plesiocystis pacifica]EDM77743.1 hypothetical protein PPSIR1_38801 [Plesiocystis pacifica SIR-1]